MSSCPSCGAERLPGVANAPCPKCGTRAVLELELDVPRRVAPRPVARAAPVAEAKLELAVDPRSLHSGMTDQALRTPALDPGPAYVSGDALGQSAHRASGAGLGYGPVPHPSTDPSDGPGYRAVPSSARAPLTPEIGSALRPRSAFERGTDAAASTDLRGAAKAPPEVGDVAFDARLLAEYGEPPRHWLFSPRYAWRVLTRQRALKKSLVGRRDEAARARHEVEDALVAFAERSRPIAEKHPDYARAIQELRGAEDVLRSRDRVLASEQDAQSARLASVDARLAKLETELAQAQAQERAVAAELAATQAGLARGESKLKRAESELRTAQQRESTGTHE